VIAAHSWVIMVNMLHIPFRHHSPSSLKSPAFILYLHHKVTHREGVATDHNPDPPILIKSDKVIHFVDVKGMPLPLK